MTTSEEDLHHALQNYEKNKIQLQVLREIRSGKEATVYLVQNQTNEYFALKVYKNPEHSSFKHKEQYLTGRYFRNASLRKAVAKKNTFGKKVISDIWTKREFYLLKIAHDTGIDVPKPFGWTSNSILMEFIGNEQTPAPRLSDILLQPKERQMLQTKLLHDIEMLKEKGIVHGDFSAFNVLIQGNRSYIIDFPQALDIRNNPNWEEMYKRDIATIQGYFQKK